MLFYVWDEWLRGWIRRGGRPGRPPRGRFQSAASVPGRWSPFAWDGTGAEICSKKKNPSPKKDGFSPMAIDNLFKY